MDGKDLFTEYERLDSRLVEIQIERTALLIEEEQARRRMREICDTVGSRAIHMIHCEEV